MGPEIDVDTEPRTAACKRCDRQISLEADKCPECGYDPQTVGAVRRRAWNVVGWLLTLTIVGAVVGFPMVLWTEHTIRKARHRRPTTYDHP